MFKFEVGKLYRIGGDMSEHVGKVIRITDRRPFVGSNHYKYEMVHGASIGILNFFDEKSVMGEGLIPVQEMIVIYRKDNKVVALDKATGKEGVARCAPDDTFNFETGAKIAFGRLVGEAEPVKPEAPKFKVGEYVKVVGESYNHGFPIGQIVKVISLGDNTRIGCRGLVKCSDGYREDNQIVKPESLEKLEEA